MGMRRIVTMVSVLFLTLVPLAHNFSGAMAQGTEQAPSKTPPTSTEGAPQEVAFNEIMTEQPTILDRALEGGFVVFSVLLILVMMSIGAWGIFLIKWMSLSKHDKLSTMFIKTFWDSRSLNDLNSRLGEYADSPAKELFRSGYAELVRASQLREQTTNPELALHAGMENMTRALGKAKLTERSRIERYLPGLAITASAAPFIGLFGTVWGIMQAFEGIAQTGNASLSAVAPGISEALIATAFGLAAAIPAAIGYNIFTSKIRRILMTLDGFSADFLNIVERYLVSGKAKSQGTQHGQSTL